jgi:hypothetical protein
VRNRNRKLIYESRAQIDVLLTAYPVVVDGTLDSAASLENNIT